MISKAESTTQTKKLSQKDLHIHELTGKDLKINNKVYEGGFAANVTFPNRTLKDINDIFMDTDIWQTEFEHVNLKFTEKKIRVGLSGTAKASLEKEAAFYEIDSITSNDEQIVLTVKLQDCEENKKRNIYFNAFFAVFTFKKVAADITLQIEMFYERKGFSVINSISDFMFTDVKSVMREALQKALRVAFSRVCYPDSYKIRKQIDDAKIISKLEPKQLYANCTHGIKGEWPIPSSPEFIIAHLSKKESYPSLHSNFQLDEKDNIRFNLMGKHFLLDLKPNELQEKIALCAQNSLLVVTKMWIIFDFESIGEQTRVTASLMYDLRMFTGSLANAVDELGESLIKSMLRNIALEFVANENKEVVELEQEIKKVAMS